MAPMQTPTAIDVDVWWRYNTHLLLHRQHSTTPGAGAHDLSAATAAAVVAATLVTVTMGVAGAADPPHIDPLCYQRYVEYRRACCSICYVLLFL